MKSKHFNHDLDLLESEIAIYFNILLEKQEEYVIFDEKLLEDNIPEHYLEMRDTFTGNIFDVHPLKVTKQGIFVLEANSNDRTHIVNLHDLANVQDRINLLQLMENNL